jgi:hypothetical protein
MKRMRKIFFVLCCFFSLATNAQFQSGDTHITGKFSYGTWGTERYNLYAIQGDLFLNDYFSVNYNFDLTYTTNKHRYFHTPLGLIGGPPLIFIGLLSPDDSTSSFNFGKGGAVLGLLLLILPDGAAAHIPIGSNVDISPYANFLGLDFIKNKNTNESWIKYSAAFGLQVTFLHKSDFTMSLYGEVRKAVKFDWMKGIGFSVGYHF